MPDLTQFSNASLFVMLVTLAVCVGMMASFLIMRQVDRILDKPAPVVKVKRKRRTKAKANDGITHPGQPGHLPRGGDETPAARTAHTPVRRDKTREIPHRGVNDPVPENDNVE